MVQFHLSAPVFDDFPFCHLCSSSWHTLRQVLKLEGTHFPLTPIEKIETKDEIATGTTCPRNGEEDSETSSE